MTQKEDGNKTKIKYLQVRLTDGDEAMLEQLTGIYKMERSALVRKALEHVLATLPTFTIVPAERQK
jgi:hypothetical protein